MLNPSTPIYTFDVGPYYTIRVYNAGADVVDFHGAVVHVAESRAEAVVFARMNTRRRLEAVA